MSQTSNIVGVWRVQTIGAPFPYHMFTFHADGTMQQSNPPAGNTQTSDTAGMGIWEPQGRGFRARFEEYRVDYSTGQVTRGAIDFTLTVTGNTLKGDCTFTIFSIEDASRVGGPHTATLSGQRLTFPKT